MVDRYFQSAASIQSIYQCMSIAFRVGIIALFCAGKIVAQPFPVIDSSYQTHDAVLFWKQWDQAVWATILNDTYKRPEGSQKPLATNLTLLKSLKEKWPATSSLNEPNGPTLMRYVVTHSGYLPKTLDGVWVDQRGDSLQLALCRWPELTSVYHLDSLVPLIDMLFLRQSMAEKRYFNFRGAVISPNVVSTAWTQGNLPVVSQWVTLIQGMNMNAWEDSMCAHPIAYLDSTFTGLTGPYRMHHYHWFLREKRKPYQDFHMVGVEQGNGKLFWIREEDAIGFLGDYYKAAWKRWLHP